MNQDFNPIINILKPYIYVLLAGFILMNVLSFFLPKTGVDFVSSSSSKLSYKDYIGFYESSKSASSKNGNRNSSRNYETLSTYELKGIYSTTSNSGWIILQKRGSNNSVFLEQFEEVSGYKLVKLYKKYVIFEKNSNEYRLELPKEKKINYSVQNDSLNENIKVNEDSISVNRKYLNSYVNDIDKVWNNIAINDVRKNGVIEGFKVDRVNKDSVFGKLGLKQGDVIKAINDNEIKSYADAFKIYNEINKLNYLKIEVLRNNETVELNYEID